MNIKKEIQKMNVLITLISLFFIGVYFICIACLVALVVTETIEVLKNFTDNITETNEEA